MHPAPADFLPPELEARAFWRLRLRLARTTVWQTFSRSRLRLTLIAALSLLLWLALFWLFDDGFRFLAATITDPGIHAQTVGAVFSVFFAALFAMLVFSAAIILYGALFRSRESEFLLSIPARAERVFLHRLQEAVVLSSWGFVLLGSPVLLAYGLAASAPWYYYLVLVPLVAAFVHLPVALGGILCLLVMYWMPASRRRAMAVGLLLALAAATWLAWNLFDSAQRDLFTPGWLQDLLGRLQLTQGRLLPSWWFSAGLLDAAHGVWSESILFLGLLIANALFFRQVALWTAGKTYRAAYSRLFDRPPALRYCRPWWLDRVILRLFGLFSRPVGLLVLKDLRSVRREPMQWSQFLIFFGLLFLYFLNVHPFYYHVYYAGWIQMVSFLNLTVVGLLMSTFTTRFIFPMLSLEGRLFWLLGLLEVERSTILWSKFLFALGGSLGPCALLVLVSDLMLGIEWPILLSHQVTCVVLCGGLSGIAVGLGARLPNFRETSPARIAAGFGGTLNLVLSALLVLVVVLLTALPCHFYLGIKPDSPASLLATNPGAAWWLRFWFLAGNVASVFLGACATAVPMWLGRRAFNRMEF